MLEPLSVEPWRLVAPAANSIASARLVFPAPAGPTSAIARVPFDLPPFVPGMRLSSVRSSGAESQECAPGRSRNEQRRTLSRTRQGGIIAPPARLVGSGRGQQPLLARQPYQRRLQLLERSHFDLADAFAADAVDLGQVLQRLWLVDQAALGEDMALALVEALQRVDQQLVADPALFLVSDDLVLQRLGGHEEILPLAFAVLAAAQRRVEAGVAAVAHAAIHRDHLVLGNSEVAGDLRDVGGLEVALLEGVDLVLHPPQVEEQFLLRGGGAHLHQAPRAQDEFLDRGTNPPHGVGRQAEAAVGLEFLHALHQADI